MSYKKPISASEYERGNIHAISRESTVTAYANWMELSEVEEYYLKKYIMPGASVLDLGCGTGRIPKVLGRHIGKYLGIDCSERMIEKAREINPALKFLHQDFLEVEYEHLSFDAVLLMNNVVDMLHPASRRQQAFDLARQVVRKSGIMICSSHLLSNGQAQGYFTENYHGSEVNVFRSSIGQFCEEVERHGFVVEVAARDYRPNCSKADWAYIASKKE